MPIYEYQCTKCGEVIEAFQKVTDEPLKRCKFCRGKVERIFSQTSFQLKGSGWYLTDYARKSQAKGEAGGDNSKSTEKKSDKSTESKAAGETSSQSKSDS